MEVPPHQSAQFHEDMQRCMQRKTQLYLANQSKNRKKLLSRSRELHANANPTQQSNIQPIQWNHLFNDNPSSLNSSKPCSFLNNSTIPTKLLLQSEQEEEEEITERVDAMDLEDHSQKFFNAAGVAGTAAAAGPTLPDTATGTSSEKGILLTHKLSQNPHQCCIGGEKSSTSEQHATASKHLEQLSVIPQYKIEIPDDFLPAKNGPIPPGQRSLIVTQNQVSTSNNQNTKSTTSALASSPPSSSCESPQQNRFYSILDCIFNEQKQTYQIMDVLVYNDLQLSNLNQSTTPRDIRLSTVKDFIQRQNGASNVCPKTTLRFEFLNSFNFSPASFQAVNQLDFLSLLSSKSLKQCLSFVVNESTQKIPTAMPMLTCTAFQNLLSSTGQTRTTCNTTQRNSQSAIPVTLICDQKYRLVTSDGFILHQLDDCERKIHAITPTALVNATFTDIFLTKSQQQSYQEPNEVPTTRTSNLNDQLDQEQSMEEIHLRDINNRTSFNQEEEEEFPNTEAEISLIEVEESGAAAPKSGHRTQSQRKQKLAVDRWILVDDFEIEEIALDSNLIENIESCYPDSLTDILQRKHHILSL